MSEPKMKDEAGHGRILLTGATGYVGGRLLRELRSSGGSVRCLARDPERLRDRAGPEADIVRGDLLDATTLPAALDGVEAAYYLVHSMGAAGEFEDSDRRAAENFAEAARSAGVRRIIYLGGLGRGAELSPHLRSRQEVGRILRESGVPTIELRASIVIGSGSLSFEMVRSLVEKLPVMVTPRWVSQLAQPIAIEDLLEYLVESLRIATDGSEVFEIGGADEVSYGGIMREYARQRGLRRRMLRVPVLTPHLSSLWLGLVTPVYARVGRQLLDGVRNPTVVEDDSALRRFSVRPRSTADAIARALAHEDRLFAETRWSDAISSSGRTLHDATELPAGRIVDSRSTVVTVPAERAFEPIRRIGGDVGWYFG
ncbi:MAG: NAD(P)H-binding protein, partial [Gemmatimonadota bacterium]|nr:NAD(P)H-binding protein [Gemmatimonadota bacterium]